MANIAVIGAGMAGLSCAQALFSARHTVQVFEKSRGLGGRIATRRAGELRFDHGAQYVSAAGEGFAGYLRDVAANGQAAAWAPTGGGSGWVVGTPSMSGLVKPLADGLSVSLQSRIIGLQRGDAGWTLVNEHKGHEGPFDAVVLAIPAPQARDLVASAPLDDAERAAFHRLDDVRMAANLTAMLAFETRLPIAADILTGGESVGWAARNASKPGRDGETETWVVQATADWSAVHLEAEPSSLVEPLTAAFFDLAGCAPVAPAQGAVHRWRYAFTETPLGDAFLLNPAVGLAVCGDWCSGAADADRGVEAAFNSGGALADVLGAMLPSKPVLPAVGQFG